MYGWRKGRKWGMDRSGKGAEVEEEEGGGLLVLLLSVIPERFRDLFSTVSLPYPRVYSPHMPHNKGKLD